LKQEYSHQSGNPEKYSGKTIRVFLVDDHDIVREGLGALFLKEPDIELVGEAASGQEAIDKYAGLHPDVVLLDIHLPDKDGFEIARVIKKASPEQIILMFSGYDSELYLADAIWTNINGFITKEHSKEIMGQAIRLAIKGVDIWDHNLLSRALKSITHYPSERTIAVSSVKQVYQLTKQEQLILGLLAKGYSNKEICKELNYTPPSVKKYVHTCMTKLGVSNRTQAALLARREGFV